MAQQVTKALAAKEWTLLTDSDVDLVSFQIKNGSKVKLKGTVGAVEPTDQSGALTYFLNQGEKAAYLEDLFPGVTGVNRLYAWSDVAGAMVISHA